MTSPVLDDLAARLRGPHGVRKALLREVGDGLRDAAEAYEEAGVPPVEAARRAADEFGDPAELAPLYQAELDAVQGRRAAVLIALAYPTLTLSWDALWRYASAGDGSASPESVTTVAALLDSGSYGVALAAAVAVPLFGRASATWIRRLALGIGTLGWLSLLLILVSSTWLAQANDGAAPQLRSEVPAMLVVGLTVVATLAVAITATLTLARVSRSSVNPFRPTSQRLVG